MCPRVSQIIFLSSTRLDGDLVRLMLWFFTVQSVRYSIASDKHSLIYCTIAGRVVSWKEKNQKLLNSRVSNTDKRSMNAPSKDELPARTSPSINMNVQNSTSDFHHITNERRNWEIHPPLTQLRFHIALLSCRMGSYRTTHILTYYKFLLIRTDQTQPAFAQHNGSYIMSLSWHQFFFSALSRSLFCSQFLLCDGNGENFTVPI